MKYNIEEQIEKELKNLISIANKYRDGTISDSLFLDVISKYKRNKPDIDYYKEYLLKNGVSIISDIDGIDSEYNDEEDSIAIKPYDTRLIDISPKPLSLDIIIDRIQNEEINLMPDFQRKSGLWTDKQKSQLMESLILRIPLPAFYFDGSNSDMWVVIDGLQRLTAIKEFFVDKTLKLKELEFLKDLTGLSIDNMPRVYVRRMKETQIITYIINPGAPINLKYNIFKRINTGGLQLEAQEIRHALYQGFATSYLPRLANMQTFKEATCYSVSSERMLDQEFVLRFIAIYENQINKSKESFDTILNNTMEYINKTYSTEHAAVVERAFEKSLDSCKIIFGKYAFRRMPDMEKRRPISKALFETWTSVLAKYSYDDLQRLADKKQIVVNKYMNLFSVNDEFINSIRSGKVSAINTRYTTINNLVDEVLIS